MQGLDKRELLEAEGKLRSLVAYHMLLKPMAYADLGEGTAGYCEGTA